MGVFLLLDQQRMPHWDVKSHGILCLESNRSVTSSTWPRNFGSCIIGRSLCLNGCGMHLGCRGGNMFRSTCLVQPSQEVRNILIVV